MSGRIVKSTCEYRRESKERSPYRFGRATVDSLAAAIYHAFHGNCECAAHPFYVDGRLGDEMELPWTPGCYDDDAVVNAFRDAAVAAIAEAEKHGIGRGWK